MRGVISRATTHVFRVQSRLRTIHLAPKRRLAIAAPGRASPVLYGVVGLAVGAIGTSAALYSRNTAAPKQNISKCIPEYADKPTMLKVCKQYWFFLISLY